MIFWGGAGRHFVCQRLGRSGNMSVAGHESGMKYTHNSGSRRPFETLPSAFLAFFKTKRSSVLLMLKSVQIKQFWHFGDIQQIEQNVIFQHRGRPQGNIDQKENRDFSKSKLGPFKNRPSGRISGHVLYRSELSWPVCFTGSLETVWEARKIAENVRQYFENSKLGVAILIL